MLTFVGTSLGTTDHPLVHRAVSKHNSINPSTSSKLKDISLPRSKS